jgi:hypothetical protein
MRTELLALLADDRRVLDVFAQHSDTVVRAAYRAGIYGEAVALAVGRASRADLARPGWTLEDDPVLGAKFLDAAEAFRQLKQATVRPLHRDVEQLVYVTWQRRWEWLVVELLLHHERLLNAIAFGDPWIVRFAVRTPPPSVDDPALLPSLGGRFWPELRAASQPFLDTRCVGCAC